MPPLFRGPGPTPTSQRTQRYAVVNSTTTPATAVVTPLQIALAEAATTAHGRGEITETGESLAVAIGTTTAKGRGKTASQANEQIAVTLATVAAKGRARAGVTALQLGAAISPVTAYGKGDISETGEALALAIGTVTSRGAGRAIVQPMAIGVALADATQGEASPAPDVAPSSGGFVSLPSRQSREERSRSAHRGGRALVTPLRLVIALGDVTATGATAPAVEALTVPAPVAPLARVAARVSAPDPAPLALEIEPWRPDTPDIAADDELALVLLEVA